MDAGDAKLLDRQQDDCLGIIGVIPRRASFARKTRLMQMPDTDTEV